MATLLFFKHLMNLPLILSGVSLSCIKMEISTDRRWWRDHGVRTTSTLTTSVRPCWLSSLCPPLRVGQGKYYKNCNVKGLFIMCYCACDCTIANKWIPVSCYSHWTAEYIKGNNCDCKCWVHHNYNYNISPQSGTSVQKFYQEAPGTTVSDFGPLVHMHFFGLAMTLSMHGF